MIDQATLVNFITVITGFSIIGGIVDTVTASYRKQNNFSTKKINYYEVLSVFYFGFYDRILPGPPLSKKYIFRSVIISIIFFFCVYGLAKVYSDVASISFIEHWPFQLTLFVCYIAIFWLVSAQTKLFISESLKTKSKLARTVFVFSDVLTSSNMFVFLFAGGLLLASNIYAIFVLNPTSVKSTTSVLVTIDKQLNQIASMGNSDNFLYKVRVLPQVNGKDVPKFFPISNFTITTSRPYLDPNIFLPDYEQQPKWKEVSKSIVGEELIASETIHNIISQRTGITYLFSYEYPSRRYTLPLEFYSNAYSIADRVEDYFWNLLDPAQLTSNPRNIYKAFLGYNPFNFEPLCIRQDGTGFLAQARDTPNVKCEKDITILSGISVHSGNYKNAAILQSLEFQFPVSMYFLSAMGLSIMFYGAVFCVYILLFIRATLGVSEILRNAYQTAPFTLGSLLLGIFIWFFTV